MLDFVVIAMLTLLPLLAFSIYLVRFRRHYQWHKRIQVTLAGLLFVTVLAFEIDIRFFTDWRRLAAPSPFFEPGSWNPVWYSLIVHLGFAIPTLFLWIYVVTAALRRFPQPAAPSPYSHRHVFWARLAAVGLLLTAVTGWIFYWMAFAA